MNIKTVYDAFNIKYFKNILEIFLINKTFDYTFGIFSWEYVEGFDSETDYILSELDTKINSIKTNCLIFANNLFNKSKKEMKSLDNVNNIHELMKIGLEFFEYIINNRLQYFKYFSLSLNANNSNNKLTSNYYESLIFQYLTLFANVISMKPFREDLRFDPKQYFKLIYLILIFHKIISMLKKKKHDHKINILDLPNLIFYLFFFSIIKKRMI